MNIKSKILSVLLACAMALSVAACGTKTTEESAPAGTEASLKDGEYKAQSQGHNGPVDLEVTVADGKISEVNVASHAETPGLGDTAMEKIIGTMVENNSVNVETVAGATFSSNAVINGVKTALKEAGATDEFLNAGEKISATIKLDESEYTYDVVVVGAGGAGLSAAVEAASTGASVAVIEKTSQPGGNTLVSGGGLNIPGSDIQIAKGIEDSVEQYTQDTIKGGDGINDKELVATMAENALDAYNWLVDDMNVQFIQDRVQQFGGHSVPRAVIPVGNKGTEMITKLGEKAAELGVDVFTNTKGMELITDESGAVVGINVENDGNTAKFNSTKGVILATGGFGANIEMRTEYNPTYDKTYKTTCVPASTGDGIVMAEGVGASLVDMDKIQVYPACNPLTGIISYVANARFDGAVLVNQEGNRFVNDMGRRDVISNAIMEQTGSYGYLVWGQEIESIGNMTQMHEKEYQGFVESNLLHKADTIEELAEYFEMDAATLKETIDTYNQYVEEGADPEFSRGGTLRTIAEGPFYIQKVAPATHHTMGGVVINTDAQVIGEDGNVIPNLYAAGEVAGGIHGTNRLGGNAITDIVVFGRIAAQNIVK